MGNIDTRVANGGGGVNTRLIVPEGLHGRLKQIAKEKVVPLSKLAGEFLARALGEINPPPPSSEILKRLQEEAEEEATRVYGAGDVSQTQKALELLRRRLAQIDKELSASARRGDVEKMQELLKEQVELDKRLKELEALFQRQRGRAKERAEYAQRVYWHKLLEEIGALEPATAAVINDLAERLDTLLDLFRELPQFKRWPQGLVYWVISELAAHIEDEAFAQTLRNLLPPVGWEKPRSLVQIYTP